MRAFEQKVEATGPMASAKTKVSGRLHSDDRVAALPLTRPLTTIGNQAAIRLLESGAENPESSRTKTGSPHLSTGFGTHPEIRRKALSIQTKLSVNEPGDEHEREADRVADQVAEMPEEQVQLKRAPCPTCRGDDDEEDVQVQAKLADSGSGRAPSGYPLVRSVLASPGRPLDVATRGFMEPRFGHDFGAVRVHTDGMAAESARALSARAYTIGQDVVFGSGQFSSDTLDGKRLLAHELTHTLQQRGSQKGAIQRADYDVDGLPPDAASFPNRIFFTRGSKTIPATEAGKLAAFGGSAVALTLKGTSSEEGTDVSNTAIIEARLTAVETGLTSAGYTGTASRVVDVTAGAGNIEYQRMRSVEIIPPGGSSSTPPAVAVVVCTDPLAGGADYPLKWTSAETEAQRLITDGKAKLDTATRAASTDAALSRFFGSSTDAKAAEVSGKLSDISAQVTRYLAATNHQCVNQCSNAIASNVGTGAAAMLTLCPTFFSDTLNERATTTVHEAVHGTPSIGGDDTAYAHHRLIEFLSPAQSIQNPDSYKLLLMTLDGQTPAVGPAAPDVAMGMSVPEEQTAKKALAWLEMYLTGTYMQLDTLYERLNGLRSGGAASWPAGFYADMMTKAAAHFGLTAPPAVSASETDQVKLAAVFHRYRTMRNVFWSPVTITKGATNTWGAGPNNSVEVNPAFFGLSSMGQVTRLMQSLVHATSDISGPLEPHYVTFMEEVRVLLGSPAPP